MQFQCQVPEEEPDSSSAVVERATESWSGLLQGHIMPIVVDMTSVVPCIEVRASFANTTSPVDKEVGINLKVRLVV